VLLNTLLAALAGVVLGAGLALFLELRDRRVRNIDDLAAALGLPVIVTLPKPGSRLALGGRQSLMQQRLMAPLPQPRKAA
jgi:hypothetical protein